MNNYCGKKECLACVVGTVKAVMARESVSA